MAKANDFQVAGDHYKKKGIEPWDAITAWGLGFLDGNIIRYIARWRYKGGLEDLKKAQHYLSKLIEIVEAQRAVQQDAAGAAAKHAIPMPSPAPAKPKPVTMKDDLTGNIASPDELEELVANLAPDKQSDKKPTK